jgi:LysM repeat protein
MSGNTDGFFTGLAAKLGQDDPSAETLAFFNTWARFEGTEARNNPLADTLIHGGSSKFNDAGVQNYPDEATALDAYLETFNTVPEYAGIIAAVRSNGPYAEPTVIAGISRWGTSGFAAWLTNGEPLTDEFTSPALAGEPVPAPEPPPIPEPAPEPPPGPAPASHPTPGQEYVSVAGDSFWKMASEAYGAGDDWPAIWQANGGKADYPDPSLIPVGATFLIPVLGAPAQSSPPPPTAIIATVKVTRGETLWGYALHFYGNGALFPVIAKANAAKYPSLDAFPNLIDVGWVLEIPAQP